MQTQTAKLVQISERKAGAEADMKAMKARLHIVAELFRYTVDFFHQESFLQLMPVMLGKSVDPLGPDPGSSIVKIPEIEYQGEKLRLVTSMILHKQLAVKHFSRIFIMSPNIRLERSERIRTGKHLFEFTQADFELRDAKMDDVFAIVEKYYAGLSKHMKEHAREHFKVLGIEPFVFRVPFKRYTTHELIDKYGEDWELKASMQHEQPFWAVCHKREFYDREDPEREGHYLNYDLVYPLGFGEGLSGAEREHEFERIKLRIERDGLPLEAYSHYLSKAKEGFEPSAGAGIGMERLARFLTKAKHVS
ncbi:asparagine synthetase, partial [Candidatus Woesearchaeota archaeon]